MTMNKENCRVCCRDYGYLKKHLKTKKHTNNNNKDTLFLKESLKIVCKDIEDIIKGYVEDMVEIVDYKCGYCNKEGEFSNNNPEGFYENFNIGFNEDIECESCERFFCSDCYDNSNISLSWCIRKRGVCVECWTKQENIDRGYYTNERRIRFMDEVKGINVEDMCEEVESDWDEEDEFYCWENKWTDEMEEWEIEN